MTKNLKFAHNKYEVIIMNLFYLCLKIFSARIIDVSMNTIRTVYIVKGKRLISTVIAFFEVLIWFEVARTALNTEINSFLIPISYAGGYATGTYIGTLISTKFIKGHYTVTIISNNIDSTKIKKIKKEGYGVTSIATETNSKYLIIEINKKELNNLKALIKSFDSKAFIYINETKTIENGYIK